MLRRYGYEVIRQTGSHIRLKTDIRGVPHQVTVPDHKALKLGTLNAVVSAVAIYLEKDRAQFAEELFERR
jgi:predicted RNA binding protein YcfA (HicA-like mRNA interferase family)